MANSLGVGDKAPNFDLSSTEDVLLMLRDEVPRRSVLVYFFAAEVDDRVRGDLSSLAAAASKLDELNATVFGVSKAKMPELKELQKELKLPFPLLRDDRDFSASYGVAEAAEGEQPQPALFAVNQQQVVSWAANPVGDLAGSLAEIQKVFARDGDPTANYPKTVINTLVDRWVN